MARVHWSVRANRQLAEVVGYLIGHGGHDVAKAFVQQVDSAFEKVSSFPRMGRIMPEYGDESVREVIVGSFRMPYVLRGDELSVIAVIRGSRDVRRLLGPTPGEAN